MYRLSTEGFRPRRAQKILEENELTERDFRMEDLACLKKNKVLGVFAPLGMELDSERWRNR